jgi:hypothetical protein
VAIERASPAEVIFLSTLLYIPRSLGWRTKIPSGSGNFGVAEYRVFTVGRDGHFNSVEPLTCADDAEAIEQAKRLVDGHDVELWTGARLVIRLRHKPPN